MPHPDDPDLRLLEAIADPVRLAILRQLADVGPTCACDFDCDVSQPTVSHHLKVLRQAGWIGGERRGTWIWYSIRPDAVARFERIAHRLRISGGRTDARRTGPVVRTSAVGRGGARPLPVLEADWRQW